MEPNWPPQPEPKKESENTEETISKEEGFWDKAKHLGKKAATTTAFVTTAITGFAKGEHSHEGDDDKKPKKVEQAPTGAGWVHEKHEENDGKITDIYRHESGSSLETAKPGSVTENPEGYKQWVIKQLQSGVSPQEMVDKKYIAADQVPNFEKYYVATFERVYTEKLPAKEYHDPYERWGGDREPIFQNNVLVAQIWYPTSETHEADKSGNLNSQKVNPIVRFVGKDGKFLNLDVELNAEVQQDYFGTRQAFKSQAAYEELKSKATDDISKSEAPNYNNFAKN